MHTRLEDHYIKRQNPPRAHFQEVFTALLTIEEVLNKIVDCTQGRITFLVRHSDT